MENLTEPSNMFSGTKDDFSGEKCLFCGKSYSQISEINRHKKIQKKANRFNCTQCEIPFIRYCDLKRHREIHVNIPRERKSIQSDDIIKHRLALKRHTKINKTSIIPYKCSECTDMFTRKFDLKQHMKRHQKLSVKHKCKHCDKVFSRKFNLLHHKCGKHDHVSFKNVRNTTSTISLASTPLKEKMD